MFGKNKTIRIIALVINRRICIATMAALSLGGLDLRAQTADPANPSGTPETTSSDQSGGATTEKKKSDFSAYYCRGLWRNPARSSCLVPDGTTSYLPAKCPLSAGH